MFIYHRLSKTFRSHKRSNSAKIANIKASATWVTIKTNRFFTKTLSSLFASQPYAKTASRQEGANQTNTQFVNPRSTSFFCFKSPVSSFLVGRNFCAVLIFECWIILSQTKQCDFTRQTSAQSLHLRGDISRSCFSRVQAKLFSY